MNPNQQQAIEYGSSATRLYFSTKNDGKYIKAASAPTYTIIDVDEAVLGTGTMTAVPAGRDYAFLDYTAQTAEFKIGEKVTGGTSAFTAIVSSDQADGTTGRLALVDVDGTPQDAEALTGNKGGAATASGAAYSPHWYVEIDASSETTWPIERNYVLKVQFSESGGPTLTRYTYFDVALYPMISPIITSEEIDLLHPTWQRKRPNRWVDWTPAINEAHSKLVNRINSKGENGAEYVKRDTEFRSILLGFIRAEIAREVKDDFEGWLKRAEATWSARGLMTISDDEDLTPERTDKYMSTKRIR